MTFIAEQSFVTAGVMVNPQANVRVLVKLMSKQYSFRFLLKKTASTLALILKNITVVHIEMTPRPQYKNKTSLIRTT